MNDDNMCAWLRVLWMTVEALSAEELRGQTTENAFLEWVELCVIYNFVG
jgi:hypothetical protein